PGVLALEVAVKQRRLPLKQSCPAYFVRVGLACGRALASESGEPAPTGDYAITAEYRRPPCERKGSASQLTDLIVEWYGRLLYLSESPASVIAMLPRKSGTQPALSQSMSRRRRREEEA